MSHVRYPTLLVTLCIALGIPLGSSPIALAHEHRQVGRVEMTVGWADEPAYAGFKNAVQLLLKDRSGKPITDLGDTLRIEVIFGSQKTGLLPLQPTFDPDTGLGIAGEYDAAIIPTRPGTYTFHFVGSIHGQKVNESFATSEKTFDPVANAMEIEFPAKDPSIGEMTGWLGRLGTRVDAAQTAARDAGGAAAQSKTLAVAGIVLGAVGIVVGLRPRRR